MTRQLRFAWRFLDFMHRVTFDPKPAYEESPGPVHRRIDGLLKEPFDLASMQILVSRYQDDTGGYRFIDLEGEGVAQDDFAIGIDIQANHCTTLPFKSQVTDDVNQPQLFTMQNLRKTGKLHSPACH